MIEKLRIKWCEDLEELLQCPVCVSRPKKFVYQCIQGHHICNACKVRLPQCPVCKQRWSSTRNRLAENLSSKLDEIKLSLMDPEDESNKITIPNHVSTSTQTDEKSSALPVIKKSIDDHTGSYPCRIGPCGVSQHYQPLIMHLRMKHGQEFSEIENDGPVFEHTWAFTFIEQATFDRAVYIPSMGTFFLKLAVDVHGNFNGFFMMVHNRLVAEQYTHQMEISSNSGHESSTYTGNLCSCRTPATLLFEKGMTVPHYVMKKMIHFQRQLKCKVVLRKKFVKPVLDQESTKTRDDHERKNAKNQLQKNTTRNNETIPKPASLARNVIPNIQPRSEIVPNDEKLEKSTLVFPIKSVTRTRSLPNLTK